MFMNCDERPGEMKAVGLHDQRAAEAYQYP